MFQAILHHCVSRYHITKNAVKLALTAFLFCIPFASSHACSVHDHGCVYHGFNATVQTAPAIDTDSATKVVMYAIGTNGTSGNAQTDFDTHALLPANTGSMANPAGYVIPTGAYITSTTPYGNNNAPQTWNSSTELPRHVYPSQYQVVFNQNTAQANHTGDFNGGENGNIPGATGCPNMPGAPNCEAVVVTGNVPSGFYQQQVQLFNFNQANNPSVDLQIGAYTTGKARILNDSHLTNEVANFTTLQGDKAVTPVYTYHVYNAEYDPHAGGVAWFDRNRSYTTGYGKPYIAGNHVLQNRFDTTDTNRTKIYKYGAGEQFLAGRSTATKRLYLGEVAPPTPAKFVAQASMFNSQLNPFEPLTGAGSLSVPRMVSANSLSLLDYRNAYWAGYNPYEHSFSENLGYGFSNSIQGAIKGVVNLGWTAVNGGAMIGSLIQEPFNPGGFEKTVSYYENNRDIWEYDNGTQKTAGFFAQIGVPFGGVGEISKANALTQGIKVASTESELLTSLSSASQIRANATYLYEKSAVQIYSELQSAGVKVVLREGSGRSPTVVVEVMNHPTLSQIQVTTDSIRHGGNYLKISTTNEGIIKVVDPLSYIGGLNEKALIIPK